MTRREPLQDAFESGLGSVIAIDLRPEVCSGVLAGVDGSVLVEDARELRGRREPALELVNCVARLRAAAADGRNGIRAVVVGIPAPAAAAQRGLDLRDVLAEHVFEPLRVEPDVNLAALGHADGDHGVSVTLEIGNRVGGAAVAGGRLVEGWHDRAGGTAWLPGMPVGLERLVTGPAIARRANELIERGAIASSLGLGVTVDAVLAAAADDDPLARYVVHEALDHLALAMIAVIRAIEPTRLVVGGTVGRGLEPHLPVLRERLAGAVRHVPELVVSPHGTKATLRGALAAARELARSSAAITGVLPATAAAPRRVPAPVRDRILAAVDPDHALQLLRTTIGVPSVVGDEMLLAGIVAGEMHGLGFDDVVLDEFASGRASAWGTMRGNGAGGLLLLGHLDTGGAEGWEERWRGDPRENPFTATVVDGDVWGRGAADGKAGLAAALAAVQALAKAGLRPSSDLCLAFVGDAKRGASGTGRSAGIKRLVAHLRTGERPLPSFAVALAPTSLAACTAQMGFLTADVIVRRRPGKRVDTRVGLRAVRFALEEYASVLASSFAHPLLGRPSLALVCVEDGPDGLDPDARRIRLVRTLLPGEDLDRAAATLEAVVETASQGTGTRGEVTYPGGRDHSLGGRPFEVSPDEPGVARLRGAVQSLRREAGQVRGAPFWSEASFLAEFGIPAAYFGPGDHTTAGGSEERVDTWEFLDSVRTLAILIAEHCGVEPL